MRLYHHPLAKLREGTLLDRDSIVITGAAGRLGAFVTAALARHGAVIPVDLGASVEAAAMPNLRRADVRSLDQCLVALDGGTILVHLAGIDASVAAPADVILHTNVVGTCNVLEAARQHGYRKVLVCSSVAVFGFDRAHPGNSPQTLPVSEDHPRLASAPYGLSKILSEEAAAAFARRTGVPTACIRPAYVLFPELRDAVIRQSRGLPVHLDAIAEPQLRQALREPLPLLGAYVLPEDVAGATEALVATDLEGFHTFVIAAADVLGPRRTDDYLRDAYGERRQTTVSPLYERNPHASVFDLSAARKVLGWSPAFSWRTLPA